MIRGREKRIVRFINLLWDLIEHMIGGREFNRVGPEYLKVLEFTEVLLESLSILVTKIM